MKRDELQFQSRLQRIIKKYPSIGIYLHQDAMLHATIQAYLPQDDMTDEEITDIIIRNMITSKKETERALHKALEKSTVSFDLGLMTLTPER